MVKETKFEIRKRSPILALVSLLLFPSLLTFRSSPFFAQLPANTPAYPVNAQWVTDKGSQEFNVKAYGATGNGTTDDTTAILNTYAAAGAGGVIRFPAGTYNVTAQIVQSLSRQTVFGYGATVACDQTSAMNCYLISSAIGGNIYGLHLSPGPNTTLMSGFQDNGQSIHFYDVGITNSSPNSFGYPIEVDNDQSAVIDHLYDVYGPVTCNASFCGAAIWGNPANGNAAVLSVVNSNLTMGCKGNSIDWGIGNNLHVSSSIIQAYSQFGIRTAGNTDLDGNNYWEQGNCTNPLNDGNGHALGGATLIALGASVTVEGPTAPQGVIGTVFSTNASGGSATYWYYVVGHTSSGGVTAPLVAGYLSNGPATISSSAKVFVVWPALAASSITTFDLLRTQGIVPYGTGYYAVATGLSASSICGANGVCAYTDTTTSPASYAIAGESWYPGGVDVPWPANLVLFAGGATNNGYVVAHYSGTQVAQVVNAAPSDLTSIHVKFTSSNGNFWTGGLPQGPGLKQMMGPWAASAPAPGLILPIQGQFIDTRKGLINLGKLGGYGYPASTDWFTGADSNWPKTLADLWHHPLADAGDAALGGDSSGNGVYLRAQKSVSSYVNVVADGMSWATRIYASGQASAVPYYGVKSVNVGAPTLNRVVDVASTSVWAANTAYQPSIISNTVIYDGANWEAVILGGTSGSSAPTWATTAGQQTPDGTVTWVCLGASSIAANTTYYIKVAAATPSGYSQPSAYEYSVTTANDSNHHMLYAEDWAYPTFGATGYQAGCSTTSGSEAPISPPYTTAYNTGLYPNLPIMTCSGSGSFNTTDTTGYGTFPGLFIGGGTAINAMNLYSTASITPTAVSAASCSDQTFTATGLLATDRISNITPPSALGNVSLNAYASAAGTVLLHFCNPGSSSVTPPAGVYSFLAVH